jgi:Spy/CpxP family protein refolding chaperone
MEDSKMLWHRLAVPAFTILALASGSLLPAQQPPGKGSDRLDAVARKLNLSDKQKEQVKQIYADFDKKADPLIRKLCTQRGEEWQALQDVLDEAQRTKLKEVLKAQGAKELQSIAQNLNLSDEQKAKVEKIRMDFWQKFLNLSIQKGENLAREYRELHMEVVAAGHAVLTPEQCTKLHAIQKQDFDDWHDYIYRHDHLKALGAKLGLGAKQLDQLQQICAVHEKKLEQPRIQLKQLCREGCAALGKVLNAEQRAKLHDAFPFGFLDGE